MSSRSGELSLYIDSDGTVPGTHICVIGEDGSCLGEIRSVRALDWSLEVGGHARVHLEVLKVPGRFLANDVLIDVLRPKRRWWRRFMPIWSPNGRQAT